VLEKPPIALYRFLVYTKLLPCCTEALFHFCLICINIIIRRQVHFVPFKGGGGGRNIRTNAKEKIKKPGKSLAGNILYSQIMLKGVVQM